MYFISVQQRTNMLGLLSWWLVVRLATVADAQQQQCSTEEQQQGHLCQSFCRCECDEYWNTDNENCKQVCDSVDNQPIVDVLPWCKDYNVAEECDIYGSNWADSTIESDLGIVYMRAYGRDFKMNFFTDTAMADVNLPLALIVHGGGFNSGSMNNCKIIESAREFASRGYRAIAIDYPMCGAYWTYVDPDEDVPPFGSGEGGWHAWDADTPLYPTGIGQQDPQCNNGAASTQTHPEQYAQAMEVANRAGRYAIQYAHSRAEDWAIDVERTVCHGASAGAVTCYEMFLFNTTVRYKPETTGLSLQPDLDKFKIDVAAGRAGGLAVSSEIRAVMQETVDAMAPGAAVYDLHGTDDDEVPISTAEFLVAEMERFDIPAELVFVEGGGHSLFPYQFNKSHPERLDDMFQFIETHLPPASGDGGDDDSSSATGNGIIVKYLLSLLFGCLL